MKRLKMNERFNTIGVWASLVGAATALLALLSSEKFLALISLCAIITAAILLLALRQQSSELHRSKVEIRRSKVEIEGLSLDLVNLSNLANIPNTRVKMKEVTHELTVMKSQINMKWINAGECLADDGISGLDFKIGTDQSLPFEDLDCHGFDLKSDVDRNHKIRPLLIGPDGVSKSIFLPFANSITKNQNFEVELNTRLPNPVAPGLDYHSSILSFGEHQLHRYDMKLIFKDIEMNGIRVYEVDSQGQPSLVKDLVSRQEGSDLVYEESIENYPASSIRVYVFDIAAVR